MDNVQSFLTAVFIIVACLGTFALFAIGLFYLLTLRTDIPVDNNSLFVGSCILAGCVSIMLSNFALVGNDGRKKHD